MLFFQRKDSNTKTIPVWYKNGNAFGKVVLLCIIFLLCMRKQVGLQENKKSLSVLLEQMGGDDDF